MNFRGGDDWLMTRAPQHTAEFQAPDGRTRETRTDGFARDEENSAFHQRALGANLTRHAEGSSTALGATNLDRPSRRAMIGRAYAPTLSRSVAVARYLLGAVSRFGSIGPLPVYLAGVSVFLLVARRIRENPRGLARALGASVRPRGWRSGLPGPQSRRCTPRDDERDRTG